jgi:RHS repeat-associated protein
VNRLNQYSSRTVAPYVDVLGVANPTTNVTVNGNTANRKGEYFHWPLNVPNSTPQYPNLTIVSQYGATQTQTGAVYVAASTESFQPDADGNLISDGRWTYTWDGENRLVQMIRDTDTPAGARQKLLFEYDHQGRRIRKRFFTYSGGWQEQTDTVFLYDGWNLVAELNANASNAKVRSYVWGTDLSGSMQGAGGVGGLLKVTYVGASTTNAFVAFDGNGNVAGLVNGTDGSFVVRYEYGPFAELIRVTGTMAKVNPFFFSSKYRDDDSDLVYYGHRFYDARTGRWVSRDPMSDPAFAARTDRFRAHPRRALPKDQAALYLSLANNLQTHVDYLGLAIRPCPDEWGWRSTMFFGAIPGIGLCGYVRCEANEIEDEWFWIDGTAGPSTLINLEWIEGEGNDRGVCLETWQCQQLGHYLYRRGCCSGCTMKTVWYEFDAEHFRLGKWLKEELSQTSQCSHGGGGGSWWGPSEYQPHNLHTVGDETKDECHM